MEQHASEQRPLHRIKYTTFGATMGSKSGEIRHNLRLAAKSHTGLSRTPPQSIILSLIGDERSNSLGRSAISRYPPYSQRAVGSGVGHNFPFRLFSKALLAVIVGNLTLTNFFANATQSAQPHRNLRQRPNSLNGLPVQTGQTNRRSSPVSHRITCLSIQLSGTSRKRHISPTR